MWFLVIEIRGIHARIRTACYHAREMAVSLLDNKSTERFATDSGKENAMRFVVLAIIILAVMLAALGDPAPAPYAGDPVQVLEARKAESEKTIIRYARDRDWVKIQSLQEDVREINRTLAFLKANPLGGTEASHAKVRAWLASEGFRPQGWIMAHANEVLFTRAEGESLEARVDKLEGGDKAQSSTTNQPSLGSSTTSAGWPGKGTSMNSWLCSNWIGIAIIAIVILILARIIWPNLVAFVRGFGLALNNIPAPVAGDDEMLVVEIPGVFYSRRRKP